MPGPLLPSPTLRGAEVPAVSAATWSTAPLETDTRRSVNRELASLPLPLSIASFLGIALAGWLSGRGRKKERGALGAFLAPLFLILGAVAIGFALVWHIWWLAIAGLLGVVVTLILRSYDDDIDYTISAQTVAGMDGTPTTPARTRDLQEAL